MIEGTFTVTPASILTVIVGAGGLGGNGAGGPFGEGKGGTGGDGFVEISW